ncbi:MAG: hypothetical protein ACOYNL_07595 [Rickettsiales bacterium]
MVLYAMTPGLNVPRGKVSNVGYTAYYASWTSNANWPDVNGNFMFVGANATANVTMAGAFKTEELWNMDTKIDDGMPARGTFKTIWNTTDCKKGAAPLRPSRVMTSGYAALDGLNPAHWRWPSQVR